MGIIPLEAKGMGCESETMKVLRRAGQKVTPQRIMVLSALRHAGGHKTAADLLAEVRRQYPFVDISTIYRTLAAAKDLRLVAEVRMGGGEVEYEWVGQDRHHHLICRRCGEVSRIDDAYLGGLAAALLEDYGFRADLDHFAIFGLCRRCGEEGS
jgi:Fur family ferric uptake transcriptional regulator